VQQRQHARWPWLAAFLSLAIVLTGALAAGASAGKSHQSACASIQRLGLEKQMNAHAAKILASCGRSTAGPQRAASTSFSSLHLLNPATYGGTDVNEITGGLIYVSLSPVGLIFHRCRVRLSTGVLTFEQPGANAVWGS